MRDVLIEDSIGILTSWFCDLLLYNVTIRNSVIQKDFFEMLDTNVTMVNSHMYNITSTNTTRVVFYSDKNSRVNLYEGTVIENISAPFLISQYSHVYTNYSTLINIESNSYFIEMLVNPYAYFIGTVMKNIRFGASFGISGFRANVITR